MSPILVSEIKDYSILRFSKKPVDGMFGYKGLKTFAKITEDHDLLWKIAMVEKYATDVREHIKRIRERHLRRPGKAGDWRRW